MHHRLAAFAEHRPDEDLNTHRHDEAKTAMANTSEDLSHLTARAHSLREQAGSLPEPLAVAYRRRASELELEAFVRGESAFLSPSTIDADAETAA